MVPSGVLLAGGASRRMGVDKAVLVVDDQRLVDRAIQHLTRVCDDLVVASGDRTIPGITVAQVRDDTPGLGPLAGLAAGLAAVRGPVAIVLAVDMPDPDLGLLVALVQRWSGQPALIPTIHGRAQPLHAVWATSTAPLLSALLEGGDRSIHRAVNALGAEVLPEAETALLSTTPGWAHNLNRPSDLDSRRA